MFDLQQMYAEGMSIRAIARATGHDRKTIRRWVKSRELPKYKPRPRRPSKLDPYKDYIMARMTEGVFNAVVLLREIRQLGYTGGVSILKEFMHPLRPVMEPKAVLRFETAPGEQAQADWGTFKYKTESGIRKVYAFALVLSYSRAMYVEFVERQDLETLIRCHLHAFEALGGVPRAILYDNMKQVVLGRDADGHPEWQPWFASFASDLGFRPQLCRPYRAQTKGRVERAIKYLKTSFWPGRHFTDLADLNNQARLWCDEVANRRIHGTTGKVPADELLKENLQPLPARLSPAAYVGEERLVSRDGFISWQGSRYGVPWLYAGRTVLVKDTGKYLEIYSGGSQVAVHPKAILPGTRVTLPGQWGGLPMGANRRGHEPLAIQSAAPEVEVRPLSAYEALLGRYAG
ncbi:MAG TPA: IS21 family transposase [Firmicutes bacterium]|nr:IS21 family transposase [Bacillota bacterium]